MSQSFQRNTSFLVSSLKPLPTARITQDMVRVHILQGERGMSMTISHFGKLELSAGIPPAVAVPEIEISSN